MPRLLLFFCVFLLAACADFKTEKPPRIAPTLQLEPRLSYINTPIILPLRDLEAKINEAIQGEIYRDDSYEGDKVKLVVRKVEPLRLSMDGDEIDHAITLNVHVKYRSKLLGEKETDMTARLFFNSKIALNEQWRLVTQTKSKRIKWIKKPKVKVAFMKIPIGGVVKKVLKDKQPELEQLIDKIIYKEVKLKKIIAKIWKDIQKPILINRKVEKLWIELSPTQLELGDISGTAEYLTVNLRVYLYLNTLVGEKPKAIIQDSIPDLRLNPKIKDDFNLFLFSELKYEDINRALEKALHGQTFSAEGYSITVRKAKIWPSEDYLIIQMKVKGDARGTLYFRGKPFYDPADTALRITDFDYSLETEESLLNTADWLLHDTFREEVQEALYFPLSERLQTIPDLIQEGVSKSKVGEKLQLELRGFEVTPQEVGLAQDGIQVLVNAKGKVRLALRKL